MGTSVLVTQLPVCDLCTDGTLADYDAKLLTGPWANVCGSHFRSQTFGKLGTGWGHALVLRGSVEVSLRPKDPDD